MGSQDEFMVSIIFSKAAQAALNLEPGPAKQYPPPANLYGLRHVQTGDFLRLQGVPGLWLVMQRVWHLMQDQTHLKLTLDGPIE